MGILVLAAKQESCSDSLLRPALLPLLHTMPPMAMLPLGSMLPTLLVLSTLPRGLLMLMPTMEDMESTLDPRLLVSPPSLMLDSLCRDMPLDMAMDLDTMARGLLMLMLTMVLMASAMLDMVMDMPDMEDTMAPMLPLLLLVVLPSVVIDSLPLLLTMSPMAMLLLGSMLLTLLVLSTLQRDLLMLMPTMVDMESTLDPRPLVSPPSPMLDSLCKDMPRDMAMDSMAITKNSLFNV